MRKSHRKLCLALSLFSLLAPTYTEASGLFYSTKAMGMAGAVMAYPLDSLSIAYNPAAAAFIDSRWDLGVNWSRSTGSADFSNDDCYDSHASGSNFFLPEFGVNQWMCEGLMTWGFILYNRSYYKTAFDSNVPLFGEKKLGLEYLHYVASPSWSIIFACRHALGITLDFHGHRLKIDGMENFANDFWSEHPSKVTDEGYEYAGGIGVTIGWISRFSDTVAIGLSYSPEVEWIVGSFRGYKGVVPDQGKLKIPQRVAAGLSIEMLCNLTVAFDVEHMQYNRMRPLDNALLPAIDDVQPMGQDWGPGLGWRDQTIFRLGIDWQANEWSSYRVGYIHHRNPVPNHQTLANILVANVIQDFITFGATWDLARICEVSVFGAYGIEFHESGRNSIPDSLGGGEVDITEQKFLAGITWGKKF